MNHAEEAAFWYHRLNDFFALTNFVVHASQLISRTTECDVLGVRLPFVYEEVGGQDDDWDPFLVNYFDFSNLIGIICEVKSGVYEVENLFRENVLAYAIGRLGMVPPESITQIAAKLRDKAVIALDDGGQIGKLLIARKESDGPFLMKSLTGIENFLEERVNRYPKRKSADRIYFGPVLFQTFIKLTAGERGV